MASWALQAESEPAFLMYKGSWFQSRIVLGKNDVLLPGGSAGIRNYIRVGVS